MSFDSGISMDLNTKMTNVVKSRLERALKLNGQQAGFDFAWGRKLGNQMVMKTLKLKTVDISIPVSEKDLPSLKEACQQISSSDSSVHWKSDSPLNIAPRVLSKLATDAATGLGLDAKTLKVTANFRQLILQGPGSCCISQESKNEKSGVFGRIILQIPLAYGFEGGVVEVKNRDQTQYFHCSPHSQSQFYMSVLYSDCTHILNAVTSGHRLVLMFDLIWNSPVHTENFKHPVAVKVLKEVRESLAPWGVGKQDNDWDMLVIPTDHCYLPFQLSFDRLKGKDRLVAQALRSMQFLEIHLVSVVNSDRTLPIGDAADGRETPEDVPGVLLEDWTDVNNQRVRFPGLQLNIPNEVIGEIAPESSVFVFWPKWQRMSVICRSGLDNALDIMETATKNGSMCPKLLQESLERIVNFCSKSPAAAWSTNPGERSSRLLKICQSAQASQEAHQLIRLLTSDSDHFVGIPSEDAAAAWAQAIRTIGWNSVENEVMKMMISSNADQIGSFARLAAQFLDVGMTEASLAVVDQLMTLLVDEHVLQNMDVSAISSCVNLVVRLESSNETSNSQRLSSLVLSIRSLAVENITQILVDVRKSFTGGLGNIPAAVEHLSGLCRHVANNMQSAGDVADDLIIPMLIVCIRLDDGHVLGEFLSKVSEMGRNNPLSRAICRHSNELLTDRQTLKTFFMDRSAVFGTIQEPQFQLIFEALKAALNSPPTAKRSRLDISE